MERKRLCYTDLLRNTTDQFKKQAKNQLFPLLKTHFMKLFVSCSVTSSVMIEVFSML